MVLFLNKSSPDINSEDLILRVFRSGALALTKGKEGKIQIGGVPCSSEPTAALDARKTGFTGGKNLDTH